MEYAVVTAAVGMDHVEYDHAVNHIVYPLLDMKSENITKYFTQFYELMEKELARKNVLVHCAAGISRVAVSLCSLPPSSSPTSWRRSAGALERPSLLWGRRGQTSVRISALSGSWNNMRFHSTDKQKWAFKEDSARRPARNESTCHLPADRRCYLR